MNPNLDLRVRKTYACLMNALLDLLKEKNLEDITVNELCDKAMVGRGTFYTHFADKYELFTFVLTEMLHHYLTETEQQIDQSDPCAYYVAFFEAFIRFMEENRASFGQVTGSTMTAVMLFSTSDTLSNMLEDHFVKDVNEGYQLSLAPAWAARFLTGAMAQSARFLVEHPDEVQKDEMVANMSTLVAKIFEADEATSS